LPTKSYKIFENKKIHVPPLWSKNGASVTKAITWDEGSTTITSARLRFTVDPNVGHVKAWVELNYAEIGRFTWILGDHSPKSEEFDIIGNLVNGSNFCKIVGAKEFGNISDIIFYMSVDVILTYEGDDPDIKPDWQKYLEYTAIGVGTTAAIITIGGALTEEKK